MLSNNFIALLITLGLALIWLRVNNFIAHRGWISAPLSRKIIHMGTGPLFVLCWLLFRNVPSARFLAALVPLAITAQFALVGLGIMRDPEAVEAMSRSGDPREILKGPLFYGIVFVILTIFYWRDSPIGIVALMLLCGGDGLADVVGKRFGIRTLSWSSRKSWGGTLSMLIGGWVFAMLVLGAYALAGVFPGPWSRYLLPVTLIALAGAAIESLPYADIDNVTVPLVAVLLGSFLF